MITTLRLSTMRRAGPRLAGALGLALLLGGCAGIPEQPSADQVLPVPEQFSAQGEAPLPDRWWRHFDDPRLNTLIDQTLSDNFSLAAARDRLAQARALARREGAAQKPQLNLSGGADRSDGSGVATGESWSTGLAAGYELDLWGRLEANTEAARLDAAATAAELQAAAISLSAETAATYSELLQQLAVATMLREQQRTNAQVTELVELRYRNGQATADEVLRQEQLAEQTGAALIEVEATADLLRHRLAILAGELPGKLELPAGTGTIEAPPLPETGVPAEWLRRRPDLQQAFLSLQAQDARVAAAVASQYPRIDFSASLSSAASNPAGLFSGWLSSLAANLAAPLFDGGQRRAAVDAAAAGRSAELQQYGQVLLEAVGEVEDALAAEARDRALLESLQRRQARAERILEQLRMRYLNGSANYLDVLSALESQQQIERELINARWALVQDRITLARALAGGWQDRPADEPIVAARANDDSE